MISFVVFVFGLVIGSFLSAFVYRLEKGESAFHGRSYCPQCKHTLAWYDLIPLISFLCLGGECRYCKERIALQDFLVELATGVLFVAVFWFGVPWSRQGVDNLARPSFLQDLNVAYLWVMASALIVIFVYDLKHYIIPDTILFFGIGLVFLWRMFEQFEFEISNLFRISDFGFWISLPFVQSIVAGIGASIFFFVIYAISGGRAMGFGDVKLAFLLGLFLGWPSILVALFFSFCLGAVAGLCLIALKKKGLKSEVPFAPFLIMGTAIAFFFGSPIIHWYLNLFLV